MNDGLAFPIAATAAFSFSCLRRNAPYRATQGVASLSRCHRQKAVNKNLGYPTRVHPALLVYSLTARYLRPPAAVFCCRFRYRGARAEKKKKKKKGPATCAAIHFCCAYAASATILLRTTLSRATLRALLVHHLRGTPHRRRAQRVTRPTWLSFPCPGSCED